MDAKKQEILGGKFDVFTGPIKDQKGAVKVAEGQKIADEDLLKFDWFVEGVASAVSI